MGLDYSAKDIEKDGVSLKLQIWDTAGQERFRSLTSQYLHNATVTVIVFDIGSMLLFI